MLIHTKLSFFSYRIINDPGVDFNISYDRIFAPPNNGLNYEKQNVYTILIEARDDAIPSLFYQRSITIKVAIFLTFDFLYAYIPLLNAI